jgi:hypothetical protein
MASLPPLVPPPGYIDNQAGDTTAGLIVAGVAAAVATVDFVVKNFQDFIEFSKKQLGLTTDDKTIVQPPTNDLLGPANIHINDTGGRWAGIPNSVDYWTLELIIKGPGTYMPDNEFRVNPGTILPASYPVIGPIRVPYEGEIGLGEINRFIVKFFGFGPEGQILEWILTNNNINLWVMWPGGPRRIDSLKARLKPFNSGNFQEPEKIRERKPYPLVPPLKPSTNPPTKPLPTPDKQRAPFPDTPPFRQPDPTPTTPKPKEAPKIAPLPFLPLPNPSTTPKPSNPRETKPDGLLSPLIPAAIAITPTTAHFIGNQKVTANGPQPSMVGISQELGRLESKLTTGARNNNNIMDDLFDILTRTKLIKDFIDGLLDSEAQKFYTITSPCETDAEGNRIEFKSTIAASSDRIEAAINRLNAIADLLQHTKNLKQPACPIQRTPLTGEPVTVNFQQID